MAKNRERINKPAVNQMFTRENPQTPEDALSMDVLIIAPVTKNYPLYGDDGTLNPEAQVVDRTTSLLPYKGPIQTPSGGIEAISFSKDPSQTEATMRETLRIYSVRTDGTPREILGRGTDERCCEIELSDVVAGGNVGLSFVDLSNIPTRDLARIRESAAKGYSFLFEGFPCIFEDRAEPGFSFPNALVAERWGDLPSTIQVRRTQANWYEQAETQSLVYLGEEVSTPDLKLPDSIGGKIDLSQLRNSIENPSRVIGLGTQAGITFGYGSNEFHIVEDADAGEIKVGFVGSDADDQVSDWLRFVYRLWASNPDAFDSQAAKFFRTYPVDSEEAALELENDADLNLQASEFEFEGDETSIVFGGFKRVGLLDLGNVFPGVRSVEVEESDLVDEDSTWDELVVYDRAEGHLTLLVPDDSEDLPDALADGGISFAGSFPNGADRYEVLDIPVATLGFETDVERIYEGLTGFPVYKAGECEVFRLAKGSIVVPVQSQRDTTDTAAEVSPNWSTELYIERNTIRKEFTLDASLLTTGNRPGLQKVTQNTYRELLGEPSNNNPAAQAAKMFFDVARTYRCFVMSPLETSEAQPYGTTKAILDVAKFAQKRTAYHIITLEGSEGMAYAVRDYLRGLGGTEFEPLKAEQRFYLPQREPTEKAPRPITSAVASQAGYEDGVWGIDFTIQAEDAKQSLLSWWGIEQGGVWEEENLKKIYLSFEDYPGLGDKELIDGTKALEMSVSGLYVDDEVLEVSLVSEAEGLPTLSHTSRVTLRTTPEAFSQDKIERVEEITVEAVRAWRECTHPRMNKLLVDEIRVVRNGVTQTLDGAYLMATLGGIIASNPQWKPVTHKTFRGVEEVFGTSDTFNNDQLERITGAGVMTAVQDIPGESPTYLFRDVSSDTSTTVFQRRSAGVAEDMLARHIDQVVEPMLGADLITDTYLDMISAVLDGVRSRHREHFYSLDFGDVRPITEKDRAKYGIQDTGIAVQIEYEHLEEAGSAIVEHVVKG